ncbi:uncharacterized protein METZ01_LOCUS451245, partial [marine metagenome]
MLTTSLMLAALVTLTACSSLTNEEKSYKTAVEFQEQGKLLEAIDEYGKVLELNPVFVDAYTNRGAVYTDLGEYQKAIQDYDQAIQLNPANEKAYSNRGNLYAGLGESDLALGDYSQAIGIAPQNP